MIKPAARLLVQVYTIHSSKRQYRDSHDHEDEEEVFTKKQRTRHLDLTKKGGQYFNVHCFYIIIHCVSPPLYRAHQFLTRFQGRCLYKYV